MPKGQHVHENGQECKAEQHECSKSHGYFNIEKPEFVDIDEQKEGLQKLETMEKQL